MARSALHAKCCAWIAGGGVPAPMSSVDRLPPSPQGPAHQHCSRGAGACRGTRNSVRGGICGMASRASLHEGSAADQSYHLAVWSSGMILASGARGPGLNSQNSPIGCVYLVSCSAAKLPAPAQSHPAGTSAAVRQRRWRQGPRDSARATGSSRGVEQAGPSRPARLWPLALPGELPRLLRGRCQRGSAPRFPTHLCRALGGKHEFIVFWGRRVEDVRQTV